MKLAAWMFSFRFRDQDFFELDPVRYRVALGERGVAADRELVRCRSRGRNRLRSPTGERSRPRSG